MTNQDNEFSMATPVSISPCPINVGGIAIESKDTVVNAYLVVHHHPEVEMVEGLILVIDQENYARPQPHVWNKIGDIHFDVTAENNWPHFEHFNNAKDILYFSVKTHLKSDFAENNEFRYSEVTLENVAALNNALINNQLSKN